MKLFPKIKNTKYAEQKPYKIKKAARQSCSLENILTKNYASLLTCLVSFDFRFAALFL